MPPPLSWQKKIFARPVQVKNPKGWALGSRGIGRTRTKAAVRLHKAYFTNQFKGDWSLWRVDLTCQLIILYNLCIPSRYRRIAFFHYTKGGAVRCSDGPLLRRFITPTSDFRNTPIIRLMVPYLARPMHWQPTCP